MAKLIASASGKSPIDEYASRHGNMCSEASNTLIPQSATAASMMCASQIVAIRDKP